MSRDDYEEMIGQIIDVFEDAIWDAGLVDDETVVFHGKRYDNVASIVGDILKRAGIRVEENDDA